MVRASIRAGTGEAMGCMAQDGRVDGPAACDCATDIRESKDWPEQGKEKGGRDKAGRFEELVSKFEMLSCL